MSLWVAESSRPRLKWELGSVIAVFLGCIGFGLLSREGPTIRWIIGIGGAFASFSLGWGLFQKLRYGDSVVIDAEAIHRNEGGRRTSILLADVRGFAHADGGEDPSFFLVTRNGRKYRFPSRIGDQDVLPAIQARTGAGYID